MKTTKKIICAAAGLFICGALFAQEKLNDFLEKINAIKKQEIEADAEFSLLYNNAVNALNVETQEKLSSISRLTKEPWESAEEYNKRINDEIAAVQKKRTTEQENITSQIKAEFMVKKDNLSGAKQEVISKMMQKEFVYSGSSVQLLMGAFNVEDTNDKHWPVVVKSLEKDLNYSSPSLKFRVNKDVLKEQYASIEKMRTNNEIKAEIYFKVEKKVVSDSFSKTVTKVVLKGANNATLATFPINETVEVFTLMEVVHEPGSVIPEL